jgi:Mn2+/Fe2+ NRAMP family transporter
MKLWMKYGNLVQWYYQTIRWIILMCKEYKYLLFYFFSQLLQLILLPFIMQLLLLLTSLLKKMMSTNWRNIWVGNKLLLNMKLWHVSTQDKRCMIGLSLTSRTNGLRLNAFVKTWLPQANYRKSSELISFWIISHVKNNFCQWKDM